jgi:GTP-binding protein EngB required for normal cell division
MDFAAGIADSGIVDLNTAGSDIDFEVELVGFDFVDRHKAVPVEVVFRKMDKIPYFSPYKELHSP